MVDRSSIQRRALYGVLAVYAALLLIYSQHHAFTWDESYHLLAAQLINAGRKPYIDFCFPQSPLNAYWNAGVMRVFGQGWRVPHVFEALFIVGAIALVADYVWRRFPVADWRFAAAMTACLAAGLNAKVFLYGPVAQPYGICLLALTIAFRVSLIAIDSPALRVSAIAGMFAGLAAASSLLTVAAVPVFVVWILHYNRAGPRSMKAMAYFAGLSVPFAPVLWLTAQGPRQTWFNLVVYHLRFRKLYWPETTRHDLEVLTAWMDSGSPLILGFLALSGLIYIARFSRWPRSVKAEFYLCAWLAGSLSVELARAHPTFPQYFLLMVPFAAILCPLGLYALAPGTKPLWATALVCTLFACGLARAFYDDRESSDWRLYQQRADKVDQVTPRDAPLFAEEPIYFLTGRTPPPGFELFYTHKVSLPPADSALFHVIDYAEVRREVRAGMFATAYSCEDEEIQYYGLKTLYRQRVDVQGCTIFWDWGDTSTAQTPSKSTK